eukprot:TRINITY_DN8793_c0_g1_i1.p1 TRINITY_DN8793_c0_g1~~TRINITY_DN8793_c0_g1_i1.p1  ORF type:complete len:237 (-),score=41.55 TRINITY_DN8793_c0_g1_i1:30-740(-)
MQVVYAVGFQGQRLKITACDPAFESLITECWNVDASARPQFSDIVHRLKHIAATTPCLVLPESTASATSTSLGPDASGTAATPLQTPQFRERAGSVPAPEESEMLAGGIVTNSTVPAIALVNTPAPAASNGAAGSLIPLPAQSPTVLLSPPPPSTVSSPPSEDQFFSPSLPIPIPFPTTLSPPPENLSSPSTGHFAHLPGTEVEMRTFLPRRTRTPGSRPGRRRSVDEDEDEDSDH